MYRSKNRLALRGLLLFVLATLAIPSGGCSLIASRDGYDFSGDGSVAQDAGERDAATSPDADIEPPAEAPRIRFPWNGYATGSSHTGALEESRNALRPLLLWEATPGAERYEIQLSAGCEAAFRDSCGFPSPIAGEASETRWRPAEALPISTDAPVGERYIWHLRGCNGGGCGPWSEARYLDVGRQPTDYNGDGYADLLVGAAGENPAATTSASGQLHIFEGPSLALTETLLRGGTDQRFGAAVVAAGDVNADGYGDFVVTASDRVYLYFGRANLVRDGWVRAEIARTLGFLSLSGAGDLDGDGDAELVMGRANSNDGGPESSGAVDIYQGGSTSLESPTRLTSAFPVASGLFGNAVVSDVDLDGDGYVDLAVAARGEPGGGDDRGGRVYIYPGGPGGLATEPQQTFISPNHEPGGEFGDCLVAAELNGDGYADLVIGAPREGPAGRAYVFFGHPELAGEVVQVELAGTVEADLFATAAAPGWGPEGERNILVSAPGTVVEGLALVGRVYAIDLATPGRATDSFEPPELEFGSTFGLAIANIGDVRGGGRHTLVMGSPLGTSGGIATSGQVFALEEPGGGGPSINQIFSPTPESGGNFGSFAGTAFIPAS